MTAFGDFEPFAPADDAEPSAPPTHQEGAALQAVRQLSLDAGLDLTTDLYNEALELARQGHLSAARDRLSVLLGLAPHDGEARLLLAKVHVAGHQWRTALAQVDQAAACGQPVEEALRLRILKHLHDEDNQDAEAAATQRPPSAREEGELRRLNAQLRELRSEQMRLTNLANSKDEETRRAYYMMMSAVAVCVAVLLFTFFTMSPEATTVTDSALVAEDVGTTAPLTDGTAPVADAAAQPAAAAAAPVVAASAAPAGSLADRVTRAVEALPSDLLMGSATELIVRNDVVEIKGTVTDFRQHNAMVKAVEGVEGVARANTDRLTVTSVTKGAVHTVASGDMLSKLAYRYYGNGTLYQPILDANPVLGGKPDLTLGQAITIPPKPSN